MRPRGRPRTSPSRPTSYTGKKNQVVVPGDQIDRPMRDGRGGEGDAGLPLRVGDLALLDRGAAERGARRPLPRLAPVLPARARAAASGCSSRSTEGALSSRATRWRCSSPCARSAPAEYVHLRDPAAAGLEPGNAGSGWHRGTWASPGTRRPATAARTSSSRRCRPASTRFKYRLRANLAGEFRVGPATVQSMYAPEFVAYSGAGVVRVGE